MPREAGQPATLIDVARLAGVSTATASRALNGKYPVSPAAKERVQRAAVELEYVVNGHARALAAAASDVIGVIVGDVSDPFFGQIVGGVQSQTFLAGQLALVCSTEGDPRRELNQLERLRRLRAGGVILVGAAVLDTQHQQALSRQLRGFPRVVLCGRPRLAGVDGATAITFDNMGGTARLVDFLITLGHQRIGYITGPAFRSTTRERLAGFRMAAQHQDPRLVVEGEFTRASGLRAAHELLRRGDVTAIVAANDLMAAGALAAARERGLTVPDDLSVAGFDDIPFCEDTHPALTTVNLPLREAGALAGGIACGLTAPPPEGILRLRANLVIRGTTGSLAKE